MTRGRSVGGAEMTGAEVTGAEVFGAEMVWGRSVLGPRWFGAEVSVNRIASGTSLHSARNVFEAFRAGLKTESLIVNRNTISSSHLL